ncbi:MAG TPA: hypothetical protein VKU40_13030, partial [Thermoanaerobaculia bacterium]|nr:hypothetical protein [Thermoanaerobaculia bacterium]
MSAGRRRALIAVAALCVVGAFGYLAFAVLGSDDEVEGAQPLGAAGEPVSIGEAQLLARAVDREDRARAGRVFALSAGHPRQLAAAELECERVYFAGGRGLCLRTAPNRISYEATVFDSALRPLAEVPLAGLPSRARVSADGRYGAATVFVNGHEYLGAGGFSTAATIIDLRAGESLGNLESFAVSKDGRRLESPDFNFWGIDFDRRDSDRFYATLRSGGHYYLVEGSVDDRSLRVLRDGVECPSLSPDGTRIAFKSRTGDEDRWRLAVLDLATLEDHPVGERRSIDDQPEWLDDSTLVYSDGLDVYTVAADGSGSPRLAL